MLFKKALFFLLLPLCLFANRIEIVPDWPMTEQDGLIVKMKNVVEPSGRILVVSDFASYIPSLRKEEKRAFALPKEVSRIVFWNIGQKFKKLDLSRIPKEKLVLFMWEPPTVQKHLYEKKVQERFSKIYT
jgi:hypothetical protein